jgi:hypothetical protein
MEGPGGERMESVRESEESLLNASFAIQTEGVFTPSVVLSIVWTLAML